MDYKLFLNALLLKKCVIKLLILILLQLNLLLNALCGEAASIFFVFDSIPDWYKTQEMCERVVSENSFLIVPCPYKYKTQRMCDEAVDDSLEALKLPISLYGSPKVPSVWCKIFVIWCKIFLVWWRKKCLV